MFNWKQRSILTDNECQFNFERVPIKNQSKNRSRKGEPVNYERIDFLSYLIYLKILRIFTVLNCSSVIKCYTLH